MKTFTATSLIFLTKLVVISPKYMEGDLRSGENWNFIARFCFLSFHGKFEYDIEYPEEYAVQNLDLYYDTDTQWPKVYGDDSNLTNCREKESVLQVENNQFINLTSEVVYSGCQRHRVPRDNTTYFRCRGSRNFKTARERWWFIAVSNCNSAKECQPLSCDLDQSDVQQTDESLNHWQGHDMRLTLLQGLRLRYKFWLTNGEPWDYLHYHYSADEFYILPILSVFLALHLALLCLTFSHAVQLKHRQLLHTTFKLFWFSVLLHTTGLALSTFSYMSYGMNGYGSPSAKLTGRVLGSAAEICFLLLLLLLAKGYTVTRAKLRTASSIKLTVFICSYSIMYVALFLMEQLFFDPGKVLYLYESSFGYGLIVLRMVGWLMFVYAHFFTLKHYPEKGGFYYPFLTFFTVWFVAGPVMIMFGNNLIAKWVREKVIVSVEHCVALLGHSVFLLLTRPSAHNKNFPFHVRTTQIGIMEAISSHTTVGNHTLESFGHHGYGVSPANGRKSMERWGQSADSQSSFTVARADTKNPNLDVFTVENSGLARSGRPPSVPATAQWTPSAPAVSAPSQPPPPYSKTAKTVYDPNAADELRDWEDRNI